MKGETIDSTSSRGLDDDVWAERKAGKVTIWVSIASVADHGAIGGMEDDIASRRLYMVDTFAGFLNSIKVLAHLISAWNHVSLGRGEVKPLSDEEIRTHIKNPREGYSIELKDWLETERLTVKAKLVKALLAMRNNNGGLLLIGFRDSDGKPNVKNAPSDAGDIFHLDKIQPLVTKYASKPFEIFIEIREILYLYRRLGGDG